jgi:ribosomal protein S18 acetylase RimI-like enzyme
VVRIHRAGVEEWRRIRDARLRSLRDAPEAFGSTYDGETGRPEDDWRSWVTGWDGARDQALFAAVEDPAWVGIALGVRWVREPDVVHLYAMWVDPAVRRRGAGRALVEDVVGWSAGLGVRAVMLDVTVSNDAAAALYGSTGFVDTGERRPLRERSAAMVRTMERPL